MARVNEPTSEARSGPVFGLDTYSYHLAFGKHPDRKANGPMTLAKCLNRAGKAGFEGVQIDPLHFDTQKDKPTWVGTLASGLNMRIEASSIGVDHDRLLRDLEVAAAWKARVLRTTLGWDIPRGGRHPRERLEEIATALKNVLPEAEGLGITIAIENHADISTPDLIDLMNMVESDALGVCLDTGNSMVFLEDPAWTAEQLLPYAVTAHLKDYAWHVTNAGMKLVGVPLGDGVIDLDEIIPMLLEGPRLQSINLECATERMGTDSEMMAAEDKAVMKSMEYWKSWKKTNLS